MRGETTERDRLIQTESREVIRREILTRAERGETKKETDTEAARETQTDRWGNKKKRLRQTDRGAERERERERE